jgi:hypothetical protein
MPPRLSTTITFGARKLLIPTSAYDSATPLSHFHRSVLARLPVFDFAAVRQSDVMKAHDAKQARRAMESKARTTA